MAYVLVQHLSRTHESLLPEILSKQTKMPVREIVDEIHLEPDNVYIIPENKILHVVDGHLQLLPRPDDGSYNRAIDIFFESLAETHQSFAIGVILTGAAFDGTHGLKKIKEFGGTTIAQDPENAEFSSMPNNAVRNDAVDFILPVEQIPARLLLIKEAFLASHSLPEDHLPKKEEDAFKQILRILRLRTGNDFAHYKQATLRRRIARRIVVTQRGDFIEYLSYLKTDLAEQDALFNDILIPVTYFFRDESTFNTLKETVFPAILKDKNQGDKVRFWSAGCSTGEEAYSLAISIYEYLAANQLEFQVQIFATDVSERVITKARSGLYQKGELENVSDERLQKFFTKSEGNYVINKKIREMCVFAVHNFVKSPPFARLDLITCRNVLIYLNPELQSKVLTTFHYALNYSGVLVLGRSETDSSAPRLFSPLVKSDKIYTKKSVPGHFVPSAIDGSVSVAKRPLEEQPTVLRKPNFQKLAYDIIFNKYTPPGVIINEHYDIVHFHGDTSAFLVASLGKPNFNLLKMAREGLSFELQNALVKAKTSGETLSKSNIPLVINGEKNRVHFQIDPLISDEEVHFLILFRRENIVAQDENHGSHDDVIRIKQLEAELMQLRIDIRDITEIQEATIEELQSTNEELLSGTEELQTLNEELETAAEELQSNNEELNSVNEELMDRQEQLSASRNYAEAIVRTIREPLVVIDTEMRIKSANAAFYKFFLIDESHAEGKMLPEIQAGHWDSDYMRELLINVITTNNPIEDYELDSEFGGVGKRTLLFNARPIIRAKYEDPLVLVAFEDISHSRHYNLLKESEERFRMMANATPMMLWMTKTNKSTRIFNSTWLRFTGRDTKQKELADWQNEIHFEDRKSALDRYYEAFDKHEEFILEYRLRRADGTYCWVSDRGVPRLSHDGKFLGFIGGSADIQIQKEFSVSLEEQVNSRTQELRRSEAFLQSVLNSTRYGIASYEAVVDGDEITDFRIVYTNSEVPHNFGLEPEEVIGKTCREVYPGIFENEVFEKMVHCMKTGEPENYEVMVSRNGHDMWLTASLEKVNNTVTVASKNITKEKNDALHLQAMNKLLGNKNRELEQRIMSEFSDSFASYKAGSEFFDFLVQELYQKTKMDYVLVGKKVVTEEGEEIRCYAVSNLGELAENTSYYAADGACKEVMKGKQVTITKKVQTFFPNNDTLESLEIEGFIGHPLKDSHGVTIGVITVMHKSEIRNTSYIESLMRIAAKRCEMEIARQRNEQMLADKNAELERNNKELESFNYIASHDLQEPLRKIQLFCSRIWDKDQKNLSPTSLEYFESVNKAADRMQNLIDALLSYSMVNNSETKPERTDLNSLVTEAMADLDDIINAKNAVIEFNSLPKVYVIPVQFRQLITNLISNGIKYGKKDVTPVIKITSEKVEVNATSYWRISVADNGIGFEKQYEHKIFELFQRLHGKTEYVGTGIGLAICKKIVQNHNGFITVDSSVGVGSTFHVHIPT